MVYEKGGQGKGASATATQFVGPLATNAWGRVEVEGHVHLIRGRLAKSSFLLGDETYQF